MGCNCNGAKAGTTVVYKWLDPNGTKVYATKEEAENARRAAGGRGPILKDLQVNR